MTEADFQSKLRRALQARLPKAVIWKYADRFTAGIPDLSVTHEGRTTWLELKVNNGKLTKLQFIMLERVRGFAINMSNDTWTVQQVHPNVALMKWSTGIDSLAEYLGELCR